MFNFIIKEKFINPNEFKSERQIKLKKEISIISDIMSLDIDNF